MPQNIALWVLVIGLFIVILRAVNKKSKDPEILDKLGNLEKVLLDIRDGTKKFCLEKRSSDRRHIRMCVKLKDNEEDILEIDNISPGGAMLRGRLSLKKDEMVDLRIFLPLYPQPITVKAKVINTSAIADAARGGPKYEVRIKFMEMSPADEKMLIETMDILKKDG